MSPFSVQEIVRATQGALVTGDLGVSVTGVWWMQWNFQYHLFAWPRRCMHHSQKSMVMMKASALSKLVRF